MNVEVILNKLEAAGGLMSEATIRGKNKGVDDALLVRFVRANRMLADLRRATLMLDRGEPLEEVLRKADQEYLGGFDFTGVTTAPNDPLHAQQVVDHIAHLEEDQTKLIRHALNSWHEAARSQA